MRDCVNGIDIIKLDRYCNVNKDSRITLIMY